MKNFLNKKKKEEKQEKNLGGSEDTLSQQGGILALSVEDEVIDWEKQDVDQALLKLVPIESLKKYGFIPFRKKGNKVDVAVVNAEDINIQNALRFFANKNKFEIKIFKITWDEFKFILDRIKNPEEEIDKALSALEKDLEEEKKKNAEKFKRKEKIAVIQDAPVAKMVEVILKNAIDGKASDIHIEPLEEKIRVRYRVDGVLHSSLFLPKKVGPAIVSRIKILSMLKIDEKRKPQDGRFRMTDLGRTIDFRVSTFPVAHGEKVVMRILDKNDNLFDLENLGLRGDDLKVVKEVIKEPYGIVLVTGPTGSGKSTTLYSILKILNKEGVNIVTLEDPVEYMIEGVSQSQVKPEIGYTFASGLRSILRQDPDIVMVGEIRDSETAELAIHAALTGHLVLSTLHTNTAIGAVPRLIDMGIQPFLLSSALKLVIGQRLVRKICPKCRVSYKEESPLIRKMIRKEVEKISKKREKESQLKELKERVLRGEIELYKGKGCNHCQNLGMKGRIGIYEVLHIDDKIDKMINKGGAEDEIEKIAKEDGYTTMKQDGIIKVLQGITTIEEVQRVTEDDSEEEVIEAKGE